MYNTNNEIDNFVFEEAYIDEMRLMNGSLYFELENVKIKPQNSCNRDIRLMRTNDLTLKITDASIVSIIEEGYKVYDANEKLVNVVEDMVIDKNDYMELFKKLTGAMIYSIENDNGKYKIAIDGEEHSYEMTVNGSGDSQEWSRFINLE